MFADDTVICRGAGARSREVEIRGIKLRLSKEESVGAKPSGIGRSWGEGQMKKLEKDQRKTRQRR